MMRLNATLTPRSNVRFQARFLLGSSGQKSPKDSFQFSECPQTNRLKKVGWLATMVASMAGFWGLVIHDGNHKTKHYLEVPSYQTLVAVEKTLDEGQTHIPALTDRHHTSQMVKNQLMAHLNSIALFKPIECKPVSPEVRVLSKEYQQRLIHNLDHLNYSEADQREIGKLAASLEKLAVDLHDNDAALNIGKLSQALVSVYEEYANKVLAQHLSDQEVSCYKRLAKQYLAHMEKRKDPITKLLLIFLGGAGVLSFYRLETEDTKRQLKR